MSAPLHIEETTIRDMSVVVFGKHQHSKLARSAIEYLVDRVGMPEKGGDLRIGGTDLTTLQEFVKYLISEKGYN